jgi:hypothetical protein
MVGAPEESIEPSPKFQKNFGLLKLSEEFRNENSFPF